MPARGPSAAGLCPVRRRIARPSRRPASQVLEGHEAAVLCLVQLPNGDLLSGSGDCTIRVWSGGKCTHTIPAHSDSVRCAVVRVLAACMHSAAVKPCCMHSCGWKAHAASCSGVRDWHGGLTVETSGSASAPLSAHPVSPALQGPGAAAKRGCGVGLARPNAQGATAAVRRAIELACRISCLQPLVAAVLSWCLHNTAPCLPRMPVGFTPTPSPLHATGVDAVGRVCRRAGGPHRPGLLRGLHL